MRRGLLRRVYRGDRWAGGALVSDAARERCRKERHHHRGPRAQRQARSASAGLHRSRRIPVRLLHVGHDHERLELSEEEPARDARADRAGDGRQPLPLWSASGDHRGDPGGGAMRADRREFCKLLGGGIVVLIVQPSGLFGQRRGYPEDPNAYLRIDEDGRVTLFSGKIEMGQGVHTSLSQMAAEELGVPLESIDIVMGDTDLCPWDAGTWGSQSTRMFGPAVRAAAAEART